MDHGVIYRCANPFILTRFNLSYPVSSSPPLPPHSLLYILPAFLAAPCLRAFALAVSSAYSALYSQATLATRPLLATLSKTPTHLYPNASSPTSVIFFSVTPAPLLPVSLQERHGLTGAVIFVCVVHCHVPSA